MGYSRTYSGHNTFFPIGIYKSLRIVLLGNCSRGFMGTAKGSVFCLIVYSFSVHVMTRVTYDQTKNSGVESIGNITVRQGRMGQHAELEAQPGFYVLLPKSGKIKVLRLEHMHVHMHAWRHGASL